MRLRPVWIGISLIAIVAAVAGEVLLVLHHRPRPRPAPVASCQAQQLRMGQGSTAARGGGEVATLPMTNTSPRPCRLFGYPALSLYQINGEQDPLSVVHTGPAPRPFTVAPGAGASLTVGWTQRVTPASSACSIDAQLLIIPKGSREALVATGVASGVVTCRGVTLDETALVPSG